MRPTAMLVAAAMGVALTLAACSGSDDKGAAAGSGAVTIEGFTFKPATIMVPAGATVTWTNRDAFAHSVKPTDDLFPVSPNIEGTPFSHTYDQPGSHPYMCGIHNSMTGTVVVT